MSKGFAFLKRKPAKPVSYEITPGCLLSGTNYLVGAMLGEGGFGKVYSANKEGKKFAIKICKNQMEQDRQMNKKEADVLSLIHRSNSSEFLLSSMDQFSYGPFFVFVMEELAVSLYEHVVVRKSGPLHPEVTKDVFQQVLLGTNALLDLGFVHCDIKLDNIMICHGDEIKVKLVDFGMVTPLSLIESAPVGGSLGYMAPEIVLECPLSEKVDSWSIGCVLFALFTGFELFWPKTKFQFMQQLLEVFGEVPSDLQEGELFHRYFLKDQETKRVYLREPPGDFEYGWKPYNLRGFSELMEFGYSSTKEDSTDAESGLERILLQFIMLLLQPSPEIRPSPQKALKYWKNICEKRGL